LVAAGGDTRLFNLAGGDVFARFNPIMVHMLKEDILPVATPKGKHKAFLNFPSDVKDNEGKTRRKRFWGNIIPDIDSYLDYYKEINEHNQKTNRMKAWELNKEVYPRESTLLDEAEQFGKEDI